MSQVERTDQKEMCGKHDDIVRDMVAEILELGDGVFSATVMQRCFALDIISAFTELDADEIAGLQDETRGPYVCMLRFKRGGVMYIKFRSIEHDMQALQNTWVYTRELGVHLGYDNVQWRFVVTNPELSAMFERMTAKFDTDEDYGQTRH